MYGRYPALACRGQRHGPGPTSYVLFNLPLSLSPELVQPSIVVESRSVSEKSVMYRYLKWVRLESECEEIYCIVRVRQNDLDAAKWSGSSKMIRIQQNDPNPHPCSSTFLKCDAKQTSVIDKVVTTRRVPVFGRVKNPFCFSSYKKINQLQSNPIAGDHLYQANFFSKVEEVLIYSRTKLWVQKFLLQLSKGSFVAIRSSRDFRDSFIVQGDGKILHDWDRDTKGAFM